MDKILHIASNISQPLGIAGILAAATFLIFRQIIKKNIFPTLTKNLSAGIITLIIKRLSLLALVSMILGFAGFAMSLIYKEPIIRNPPLVQFQNVIFSGYVIDARTAQIIRGAKIVVKTQDKVFTDESDSRGAFVVRLQLPTDDLTVDLRVEANDYVTYFEHQVLATSSKSVALETIKSTRGKQGSTRADQSTNTFQSTDILPTDRNISGIEISYKPSAAQWSRITNAYREIESPAGGLSYTMTPLNAERIRGYWVINFEPIAQQRGYFRFSQVSTDQTQNQKFEDVIKAALIPLSLKWGDGREIRLNPSEGKYPAAVTVSKDKVAFAFRPPETILNANDLKANPTVTLKGESDVGDLRIRSLDPGIIIDQTLHLDWRRESNLAETTKATPYTSGPYPLTVGLTTAPAAVTSNDKPTSESDSCESMSCGSVICTPNPGMCLQCADCGVVCCEDSKNSTKLNMIGGELRDWPLTLLLWK
jgi:hypothetical protein